MSIKQTLFHFFVGVAAFAIHASLNYALHVSFQLLWAFYLFFFSVSLFIAFYCSASFKKNPDRLGLTFISLTFAKILLFTLIFAPLSFSQSKLTTALKINMTVPFLLFTIIEVMVVYKLLNAKEK